MLGKPGFFLGAMTASGLAVLGLLRARRADHEARVQFARGVLIVASFAVGFPRRLVQPLGGA